MTDINKKVEDALKAFESFKTDLAPKLEKMDAIDTAKFQKMEKDMLDGIELSQKAAAETAVMAAQVKALEAAFNRPGLSDDQNAKEQAKKTSEVFREFLTKTSSHPGDFADFAERKGLDVKALSVQINQDGGFLVPTAFGGMVDVRVFETSPVRQFANVETISTSDYEIVLDNDEAGAGWVGETTTRSETTTPTLDKRLIPTHEMYAEPRATQKFLDDAAVNVEAWLAGKVANKFARTEATAFISGDGVAKPSGILAYTTTSTAYDPRKVQVINSTTQGQFTYAGLAALQNALKEPYQANARFMLKRTSFGLIMQIKTGIASDNRPIFNMLYDKNAGVAASILDRPVNFADDVPAAGNDINAAIYGDFKAGYTIVDRIGLRILRDPYTAKPFVKFYTTKRVGGDVVNAEALKILALSN